ncbi:hypothetical protein A3A93_01670 [Candidatus Roizmanbacteria bacterium RIFCSPLOWO2_01_FULL_38_12]|uniref:Serine aminopeptidase S33 domain-containing protein n=1 Tax=Candidatus Roizmanbacteria bacterium RIFCSPLOWO2_01_FULL_38_12 TaxID=1802061 RepID=A0A1F7IY81_9BACT|nr:MAG: hypothetical protein A2861_02335 [Candidatus Roizmanbacteria bacterium RIFCSPHIGHO2_01_FULL_38_15]OGK34499.1 MAG: hypothetical protein A3F59_04195 [Candidatus Roizmanbacteria bacterium RIFCSPHIGHO2_12_FULL_38_13]OGK48328.1 MAG: hypothetical protein A3A93_01670 [Candidatus Roizmanbacteria bacterium RIFCSPLOWO2_01_FULL_38_12]
MNNKFILVAIVVVISLSGTYFLLKNKSSQSLLSNIESPLKNILPSPTPFPFEELTIPYLRSRDYESEIAKLTKTYDASNYTAYLTSYDSDGLKINGLLTRPTSQMPDDGFPAIVFVHGYIPPSQYKTTEKYYDYVDFLARNGFVVFKIDLRGHGESEGEPGGAYYSADYIVDTLNARAALQSTDFVNPKKIGLWGHSMSGNVVMRSFAAQPEIPAIAIWAGAVYTYSDWEKYTINDSSYVPLPSTAKSLRSRQRLFDTYGDFDPENTFWKSFVPTNYLSDLQGAIGIFHAMDDPVVNIGFSRDFIGLLDDTNVPHELHEYPSGGHNISGANFSQAMQDTVEFFKIYLGG